MPSGVTVTGSAITLTGNALTSTTSNPSTTGVIRLAKTDFIGWRDNGNANDLELAIDGSDNLTFNGVVLASSSGVAEWPDGTVSAPGATFASDLDNGAYRTGANAWSLACGGGKAIGFSTTVVTIPYSTASTTTGTGALVVTGGVGVGGVVTAGAFGTAVATDSTTGAFRLSNTGLVSWRNQGASANLSLGVDANNTLSSTAPFGAPDGTVSLPGVTFASDLDNGFYRTGANAWSAACAGAQAMSIAATVVTIPYSTASTTGSTGALVVTGGVGVGGVVTAGAFGTAGATDSTTGAFRLSNAGTIGWRNAGASGNLTISCGATDNLVLGGVWSTTATNASVSTLTNSPAGAVGNPDIWMNISVNGTAYMFPLWTIA